MINPRKPMHLVRQLLHLLAAGYSLRECSKRLAISRNTVRSYVRHLKKSSLDWQQLWEMEDKKLQALLVEDKPTTTNTRHQTLHAYFPSYEKELAKPGVSKQVLWVEYKEKHPEGYQYRQFCQHFQDWQKSQQVSLHLEYKAGDKLLIDYAGQKLYLTDIKTGQAQPVEVFVGILGCSQLTFVKATCSQSKEDTLACLADAFTFLGGVPQAVVPDNLKAMVTTAHRFEPQLNATAADFALHYHTTILPARARKPKDKALVESAVNIAYSRIYAPLRNRVFYSLAELNAAIAELVEKHNHTPFQGKEYSRRDLFEEKEQEALQALPVTAYELKYYRHTCVQKNCHVYLPEDKHYYSVPYRYVGKEVTVIYTATSVEVYYQYERIATHARDKKKYSYSTVKEHLPPTHQWVLSWSKELFLTQAASIGPFTLQAIETILAKPAHPEQNYKSCQGILQLEKKVGKERLEKACGRALCFGGVSYQLIRTILDRGLEQLKESSPTVVITSQAHENIRGSSAYQ